MKKNLLKLCIIVVIIIVLFKYNYLIKNNVRNISLIFIKDILPSMFPIVFMSNYIKYNILENNQNSFIYKLSLCLSFSPSNVLLINSDHKLYAYSSCINPLFSYVVIKHILGKNLALLTVLTNIIISYIFIFKYYVKEITTYKYKKQSLSKLIEISIKNIINIYGVIIFFNVIITISSIYIFKPVLFFIEITNGFYLLNMLNNLYIKIPLIIFLNSFGSLSIYFQQKSINKNINASCLKYKLLYSTFITIITISLLCVVA